MMIREMQETDIPIISRIYKSANPHATVKEISNWTLGNLQKVEGVYLILEKDGKIAGGISSYVLNDIGHIDDIAIKWNVRRKGYGSILMVKCLKKLKEKGIREVMLSVHYKCAYALPFYYKHGFRMIGVIKDCFGRGHDCVEMERFL